MREAKIAIIDYGMGNLRSVSKALESAGANACVTSRAKVIDAASAVVFPGVGSFDPAVKYLERTGLTGSILKAIADGKLFLGLCLGFQLLFKASEEGKRSGLAIIPGRVRKFRFEKRKSGALPPLKIPHMGWNMVRSETAEAKNRMFKNIPDNSYFYFVHSYYGVPDEKKVMAASTGYGIRFCSAIIKDNIWACQFHPEKSGNVGLQLLANFTREVKRA